MVVVTCPIGVTQLPLHIAQQTAGEGLDTLGYKLHSAVQPDRQGVAAVVVELQGVYQQVACLEKAALSVQGERLLRCFEDGGQEGQCGVFFRRWQQVDGVGEKRLVGYDGL